MRRAKNVFSCRAPGSERDSYVSQHWIGTMSCVDNSLVGTPQTELIVEITDHHSMLTAMTGGDTISRTTNKTGPLGSRCGDDLSREKKRVRVTFQAGESTGIPPASSDSPVARRTSQAEVVPCRTQDDDERLALCHLRTTGGKGSRR